SDATLRTPLRDGEIGNGLSERRHVAADHRGQWQTAFCLTRSAAVSTTRRRHDLKPTIEWQLQADKAAKLDAELAYVTGGMSWEADYNIVAPEKSDLLDFVGWVTMDNQSGKTFENAKIKLMAGDVSKIQQAVTLGYLGNEEMVARAADMAQPVTEKAFEDYHLYTLARPATLRDRETK